MSTRAQILEILSLLAEYYNREPSEAQARIYLRTLDDLEPSALRHAAYRWIAHSPFFPKVSDLRQEAAHSGAGFDGLGAEAEALERAFYLHGRLDSLAWQTLAERLERAERPHRAARLRERLARLQGKGA